MSAPVLVQQTIWAHSLACGSANALIVILWLWLYRSVFDYLANIFSREDFRTNQIVLIWVLARPAFQIRKEQIRPRWNAAPQWFFPALTLALGCMVRSK